jgi:hypothetical protein
VYLYIPLFETLPPHLSIEELSEMTESEQFSKSLPLLKIGTPFEAIPTCPKHVASIVEPDKRGTNGILKRLSSTNAFDIFPAQSFS